MALERPAAGASSVQHNMMHFVPTQDYFEGASELEISLVARVAGIVNLHVLRGGMFAATGHVVIDGDVVPVPGLLMRMQAARGAP